MRIPDRMKIKSKIGHSRSFLNRSIGDTLEGFLNESVSNVSLSTF